MVIEEKYGFNRSSVKTFVTDQIRNLLLELLLSTVLCGLLIATHKALGDWMILVFALGVFCITLLISFLYPVFSRLGNKFEPLEEGELKETVILTPEIINQEDIDIRKELNEGTLDAPVKPTQDVLPPHHAKVYTENDEMAPEIEANDPVFVRFLASRRDFISGRMYFVDLDNGSVVRWVVREDEEHIRLISMKDEEVVPLSRVRSISEVVAITKRPKTLPKERVTMEEAIARKDNQIDSILDQNSRLIGIIEKKL
jgi:hypothetical protein